MNLSNGARALYTAYQSGVLRPSQVVANALAAARLGEPGLFLCITQERAPLARATACPAACMLCALRPLCVNPAALASLARH